MGACAAMRSAVTPRLPCANHQVQDRSYPPQCCGQNRACAPRHALEKALERIKWRWLSLIEQERLAWRWLD